MQAEQNKDPTERQMTKIAREAAKFTVQMMKADGIGTAEFDFIHLVRHNPGMTQADVRAALKIDKGAAARRAARIAALHEARLAAEHALRLAHAAQKASPAAPATAATPE